MADDIKPRGLTIYKQRIPATCRDVNLNNLDDNDDQKDAPCNRCRACLLREIRAEPWSDDIARGTQQYGAAKYMYVSRTLVKPAAPMPPTIAGFAESLGPFTQCIVNRYRKGEYISNHVDHKKWFGPCVMTISLCNSAILRFKLGARKYDLQVDDGDVVVLEGDARYKWSHETLPLQGAERVSVTYRTMADGV